MLKFNYKSKIYISINNNMTTQIYTNKKLFSNISDKAFEQLFDISKLPSIMSPILAMPDIHPGFGVPIGSCFVCESKNAIISPEAVGYDINCGIRLIKTNIKSNELSNTQLHTLANELKKLPLGLSNDGIKLTNNDFEDILTTGVDWCVSKKYCERKDLLKIFNKGKFKGASSKFISKKALKRGKTQIGTLGQGNHFVDIVVINKIFNKNIAKQFGLEKNQICILLHSGSRGLGHQIATDYHNLCDNKKPISYIDFNSELGQKYYNSMLAAANFAFVNRAVLTSKIENTIIDTLNVGYKIKFSLLYDLTHNIATLEKHNKKQLLVHRKGATKVCLSNEFIKSNIFSKTGAPIILPGSMLDLSYVLVPDKGVKNTFNTVAHGSGRLLSRKAAKEKINYKDLKEYMKKQGVILAGRSENLAREEQPSAYKSSNEVVKSMEDSKLVKKVVSLKPIIVLTG